MNDPDNAPMSIGDGVGSRFSSSSKQNDAESGRQLERLHREVEVAAEKRGARNSMVGDATKAAITAKPVRKDNDYLSKLTGILADDYQTYLKQRDDNASSPTFYFDMADWFYTRKDKETALRILTNIAEMDLENASLYRLLGYRLKEYGEFALEKFVCKKVIEWRPMEPQSHRDYALALDDNGETQAALDSLYALLAKTYSANISSRSRGIEEVVITEISRIVAKDSTLATSNIDERLKANMLVDVRVVINWNLNNTNVDLHIRDPLGMETASNASTYIYKSRQPIIGGRISEDNRSGYGPEQFMLKRAIRGTYRIYVDYYGDSQFTQSGPLTVMAEIFTKYGDSSAEQRRVVCLQLSKASTSNNTFNDDRRVLVAEIEL